jgi:hypothetical protein
VAVGVAVIFTPPLYNHAFVILHKKPNTGGMKMMLYRPRLQGIEPNSITYNILLHYNGDLRRFDVVRER